MNQELRYYAYLAGNVKPPASVKMDPFVPTAQQGSAATPLTNPEDQFQSISAQPQYNKHSHEVRVSLAFSYSTTNNFLKIFPSFENFKFYIQELRVAFLLFGREMTSDEILRLQNPSATSVVPPPPSAQPIITIPTPSIFTAPTSVPPLSKFTFGLW